MPETFRGDLRIDVEKQPAARVAEPLEVPNVQGPALAVEANPLLASRRLAEQLRRVDAPSARGVDGANQAFVTDGTAMGKAVDRLKVAGKAELVALAAFSSRGVFVKKKRRRKIHHVHGAPASLRIFRYRQKDDEYAIGRVPRKGRRVKCVMQPGPGRIREQARLKRQLGEAEGEVVSREGGEVEIRAEHVIRPIQGKGVRQGDAELRAGSR